MTRIAIILGYVSFDGSTDGIYVMEFLSKADITEIHGYTVKYKRA